MKVVVNYNNHVVMVCLFIFIYLALALVVMIIFTFLVDMIAVLVNIINCIFKLFSISIAEV